MKTLAAVQSFIYNRRSLNRRPTTVKWYQRNLNRFIAFYPDELPMEPEPIEAFLAQVVPDEEKDETLHAYYRTLKALYRFICRRQRLLNPMDLIDPPKRKKKVMPTLNSREMMQLSRAGSLRDRTLLSLFIDSGPRAGEAASLRRQDIFDDYIRVEGKTGQREIPISEETKRLLLSLAGRNGNSDHVFMGERGPLTPSGIYRIVQKYMRKVNINGPKLGPHRIRHAFGKHYIKNGGDTRSLQKIMGHASISTTEIYVKLASEEIIAKHHQFTPLRSTHAAAQESFFDTDKIIAMKEAEEILKEGGRS
jgi:integrase/recombinase XerD